MDPGVPALPNQRYKMCRIMCERRNGWSLRSFCEGNYSAICTPHWRNGHQAARCVSPRTEWIEKRMSETQCCVDATVKTRGKAKVAEADTDTRAFCLTQCSDAVDRERDWTQEDIFLLCKRSM
mmetsp:Transcript_107599/g.213773  ORF Transcript_107599/g.213773 Transcript_107599/m.213773 type:complete len:123 (-) Transcript_107599:56-424(-)